MSSLVSNIDYILCLLLYLRYINVALAVSDNASPVHDKVFWGEAGVDNAVLITSSVNFEGLKEFSVLLGNWLDGLAIVKLDVSFSIS